MFPGHPLFDTADRLPEQIECPELYPSLQFFLDQLGDRAKQDWMATAGFLQRHAKSPGSYSRFRGELQRLLNFLWLKRSTFLQDTTSEDLEEYREFIREPPIEWQTVPRGNGKTPPPGSGKQRAFHDSNDLRCNNPYWRPFVHSNATMKKASQEAMLAALSAFFKHLANTRYVSRSPVHEMSKRAGNASSKSGKERKLEAKKAKRDNAVAPRLTLGQWMYLHDTLLDAADQNPKYETHLFVVVTMKTLYLRVFELAPHGARSGEEFEHEPVMGDFCQKTLENKRYWHLYVHGKGDEERFIPLPEAYLPYLKRYRAYRGLAHLPTPNETSPLVSRQDSNTPYRSKRSLENIVQEAFELAAAKKESEGETDAAQEFIQVAKTTHILRHTGASMDIEAGRPIRDVSEDLGHKSPAFTESIYVNADEAQRYTTGLKRLVV